MTPSPCSLPFLPFLFLLSLICPSLSHSPLRWSSSQDPCYHLDGRPRHCLSEFINAAYGVPVRAGESQGGAGKNVSSLTDLHNPHNLSCWLGEGAGRDWTLTVPLGRRFEVTYISLQFCQQGELPDSLSISILKSMDYGRSWRPLQFYSPDCPGKFGLPARASAPSRHQETEPLCSDPRPLQRHRGGLVLAFSTLDGRPSSADFDYSPVLQDWVTATDIRVVFHRHQNKPQLRDEFVWGEDGALRWRAGSKEEGRSQVDQEKEQSAWGRPGTGLREPGLGRKGEEFRTEAQLFGEKDGSTKKTGRRGGRRGEGMGKSLKKNGSKGTGQAEDGHNVTRKEEEGITQGRGIVSSRKGRGEGKRRGRKREGPQRRGCTEGVCDWTVEGRGRGSRGQELRKRRNHNRGVVVQSRQRSGSLQWAPKPPSPLSSPPPLSLSDLQVGGRCKCNGHASRCRRDAQGQAVCQCEHHTAGPDCDVCQPFYYDRPWQRATPTQPHPCVPCECNGHSTRCRFSMEVFQQSGRRSGGVCLKCKHHTAGRHCQYCQSGYTRDHSKPLSHRQACRPCQCHPMGAVGRWCNQTSGQCLCRDGVTGLRCNRCAPGYQQGRSPLRPCLRIQEVVPTTPVYQPQYSIAEECGSYCQPSQVKVRMNLDTYCLKDYVLKVQVRGMERSGPWWQFSVWVQSVFRTGASQVRRGLQALWVPDRDLGCGCPALQVGRTFLLIGAEDGRSWGPEESRLVADRSALALPWREHWSPKLRGFRGQDRRGRCPAGPQGNGTRPLSSQHSQAGFTPPHLEPPPLLPPTEARQAPHAHSDSSGPPVVPDPQSLEPQHTQSPPPETSPQLPQDDPPSLDTARVLQSRPHPKPSRPRKHSASTPAPSQPPQPPH
ncbi:netrin-1 [Megalops cyprinoides]|uniref:netrin-1 n=1 Tax=Megalops cyprinoides TaxID=118141 RepID=UPI001863B928|nr:netrin-1 [Megalops cyprinoides]XP_036404060.1 netrin-1 [Megalops cyprinoides]